MVLFLQGHIDTLSDEPIPAVLTAIPRWRRPRPARGTVEQASGAPPAAGSDEPLAEPDEPIVTDPTPLLSDQKLSRMKDGVTPFVHGLGKYFQDILYEGILQYVRIEISSLKPDMRRGSIRSIARTRQTTRCLPR